MDNVAKILVVDDEPFNLEVLTEILTNQGYDVLCREDGESALKSFPIMSQISSCLTL